MKLLWEDRAWSDYLYWQTQDKKTLKRIIVFWIGELQLCDPLFTPAHNRPFLSQSS